MAQSAMKRMILKEDTSTRAARITRGGTSGRTSAIATVFLIMRKYAFNLATYVMRKKSASFMPRDSCKAPVIYEHLTRVRSYKDVHFVPLGNMGTEHHW